MWSSDRKTPTLLARGILPDPVTNSMNYANRGLETKLSGDRERVSRWGNLALRVQFANLSR